MTDTLIFHKEITLLINAVISVNQKSSEASPESGKILYEQKEVNPLEEKSLRYLIGVGNRKTFRFIFDFY